MYCSCPSGVMEKLISKWGLLMMANMSVWSCSGVFMVLGFEEGFECVYADFFVFFGGFVFEVG